MRFTWKESYTPFLFIIPAIAYEAIFAFYPTFSAIYGSFFTASGKFSLTNYHVLAGLGVTGAIWNTVVVTVSALALQFLVAFIVASILMKEFKGKKIFYVIILIPFAMATVVSGFIFSNFFGPVGGYANSMLHSLGLSTVNWSGAGSNYWVNVLQLVVADSWDTFPLVVLILFAGLSAIPKDIYDAASIDGAGRASRFLHITIPNMAQFIVIALIIRGISEFNIFVMALLLFPHPLLTTMAYGLFSLAAKPFLSYAAATVLFGFVMVFAVLVVLLRGRLSKI